MRDVALSPESLSDPLPIEPFVGPVDATAAVPGSKSITNRALVCAALADGRSELGGMLFADDTEAMIDALERLGAVIDVDRSAATAVITGTGGELRAGPITLDARSSGTTARFLGSMLALGPGPYRLDGSTGLRARPMAPAIDVARQLGAKVAEEGERGRLPIVMSNGNAASAEGAEAATPRTIRLRGDATSQALSGALLAGPAVAGGVRIELTSELVSRPYVDLTNGVMASFGADVRVDDPNVWVVAGSGYKPARYRIEPDATAATYFCAAAAICGGRVRVDGLGAGAAQGDVAFVAVLERMGVEVRRYDDGIEVIGTGQLHGVEVDLGAMSDTAQTLAAVAVFADSPTRVTGIGFIHAKETDRIRAVVTELQRLGVDAVAEADGFVVRPRVVHGGVVNTYDDHRMAMSFALIGLRVPGIEIADPGCVAKTFPSYFEALEKLRPNTPARGRVG